MNNQNISQPSNEIEEIKKAERGAEEIVKFAQDEKRMALLAKQEETKLEIENLKNQKQKRLKLMTKEVEEEKIELTKNSQKELKDFSRRLENINAQKIKEAVRVVLKAVIDKH